MIRAEVRTRIGTSRVILPAQLRMARAGLGWSLAELAQKAGVNPNTLSRYERGKDVLTSVLLKTEKVLRAEGVLFDEEGPFFGVRVPRDKIS